MTMVWRKKILSAVKVQHLAEPGRYHAGDGLYLDIKKMGSKSWVMRYMLNGRKREMGLGPIRLVTLAEAREETLDARRLLLRGVDPIEARKKITAAQRVKAEQSMTFRQCAEAYIEAQRPGWRNAKHAQQWPNTLEKYAYPVIGELPTQYIATEHLLSILEPIWYDKTKTANRVRGRIEPILDAAKVKGYRLGDNPARWRVLICT